MQMYKLREAIVGIDSAAPNVVARLISIPAESVVRVPRAAQRTGIVEIEFEGRMIGVFLRDLNDRGELVQQQAAG